MTVKIHKSVDQGSEEWHRQRTGLLTASEMGLVVTPTLKVANNEKVKSHVWEIAAQQVTGYTEPTYISDAMLRGHEDEITARELYSESYDPVEEVGFITNDRWGFTLGYSPDGLVGDDGLIEIKSRLQKYQMQTLCEEVVPKEYVMQVQTAMLVSERQWLDYISYSAGLEMFTFRVWPDEEIQNAIVEGARSFYESVEEKKNTYREKLKDKSKRLIPTERNDEESII